MTSRSLSRRDALKLVGLTPVALGAAMASPAWGHDLQEPLPTPSCGPPPMGMVGIVRGQMAGLGLFHHAAIPCSLIVEIVGLDGKAIATEKVTVPAGGGVYRTFDLAANLGKEKGNSERLMFHVMLKGAEPPPSPDHVLGAAVELFDSKTGRAMGVVEPCELPGGSPALAMGMVGVAPGQIVRVGLFHHEAIPCSGVVEILGVEGKILFSEEVTLPPGGGGFVDFPIGAGLARGERLPIHVHVHHEPNHQVSASLELFDPRTGLAFIPDTPCASPRDPA